MKNFIIAFLTITLIWSSFEIQAQAPVYTHNDYAQVGDQFTYTHVERNTINVYLYDILKDGANKNWNFKYMWGLGQYDKEYHNPQGFSYAATYLALCGVTCYDDCMANCNWLFGCGAYCVADCGITCAAQWASYNLGEQRFDDLDLNPYINFSLTDMYTIQSVNSSGLTTGAIAAKINNLIPLLVPYTQDDEVLKFPMTYGNAHTSDSKFGLDLNPIGLDLQYEEEKHRDVEVVGYGTVSTPYGTFTNALKVKTFIRKEILVSLNGLTFDSRDWPDLLRPDNEVLYTWYVPGIGTPVLEFHGYEKWGIETVNRAYYLDDPRWWWPFARFDHSPVTNVFELEDRTVQVDFINQSSQGAQYEWSFGDGAVSFEENPSHVYAEGGWYDVSLKVSVGDKSEIYSEKIYLPTKSTFNPDEIADIIANGQPQGGSFLGDAEINAYPNPFADAFMMDVIAPESGEMTVQLFDMYGRELTTLDQQTVTEGQFIKVQADLSEENLPAGVYMIKVTTNNTTRTIRMNKM